MFRELSISSTSLPVDLVLLCPVGQWQKHGALYSLPMLYTISVYKGGVQCPVEANMVLPQSVLHPDGLRSLECPISYLWASILHSSQGGLQMKRYSPSYVIKEVQIKTMRCHYTSIRMTKHQNSENTKYSQGCEATGTHSLLAGLKNGTTLEDSLVVS